MATQKRLYYEGSYLHENQKQSGRRSRQPPPVYSLLVIMERKKEIGALVVEISMVKVCSWCCCCVYWLHMKRNEPSSWRHECFIYEILSILVYTARAVQANP